MSRFGHSTLRPEDTHPDQLTRMRILHETQEYLEQDADWHDRLHAQPDRCERHPNGGPTCWHNATQQELRRLGKAVAVAPTLDICEALLRDEHVPIDRLDPIGFALYGRRP